MAKTSRFSISSVISMKDKISPKLRHVGNKVRGFSAKMRRQFRRAGMSVEKLGRKLKQLGGRVLQGGLIALAAGAAIVTRQFIQFDDAIFAAAAKFGDLNLATEEGRQKMEQLRKSARKVGEETKFNAVEAAQGLDFLALAGFNADQAMAALPGTVKLATVANIDLATATDIATDSLGAFNLMTDDSLQLQKNLARVNDVMAKTTATSNTTLIDLFESVKKGAPTFTAAGQSIETFSALVGTMANSGVKGSEAGTQLRNMMLRLVKSSPQAQRAISGLGVNIKDADGNFLDAIDIIGQFEKGLKGMGTAQKSQALSTIFGTRAVTGMNILLAQGSDKLRTYRDGLLNSGGAASDMANIIEQSLGNRIKALGSALTELGFKFIDAFQNDGRGGIVALTEAIRAFNPQPIIEAARAIGTVFKVLWWAIQPVVKLIEYAVWGINKVAGFTGIGGGGVSKSQPLAPGSSPIGPRQFASPESSSINRTNTTTNKLDVNVSADKGSTANTEFTGPANAPFMMLNTGAG